ncbi:branched-chain amino acid ABC transporter permease [Halomarina halobia]|uniref:Branched-chain amino acid ABC transporter permease n=1 Tax=Halomarina halobia TaxID=3033386 RepID=A0ABD6AEU2_9EURY|nr:branched-chain amino acid ABC transporter permease [Halomarina sp. PSR21]
MVDISAISQVLAGGLLLGVLWGVVALGLNLIFGVMRVINLAHGEFLMLGAFLTLELQLQFGIHPFIGIFLLIPVFFVLGLVTHYLVIERIIKTENAELMSLLATFALLLIMQNVGRAIWSTDTEAIQDEFISQTVNVFGVGVSYARVFSIVVAIVTMVLLYVIATKTEFGYAMRATVQNRQMAEVAGINTRRVYFITFGISVVLAGLAGSMVGMIYPFTVNVGFSFVVMGFLVIVFGGMGSFVGAMAGALVLGMIGSTGAYFFGSGARDLILLGILVVTLFVKPDGVFGEARV